MGIGRSRAGRTLAPLALCLLLSRRPCLGQTTGSISGHVADPAGGSLPGATVEATSPNLQGTRTAVTDRDGAFRFPSLPPGVYRVSASLGGFQTAAKSTAVTLDGTATVELALGLAATEQVIISCDVPPIDDASNTTGTTYTSSVISRLPVSRNYADIVKSNPGVSTDRGVTQGRSLALTIYGATSAENQWIIDGVTTTNVTFGVQGKAINNEFVQEVEVKTGGYQAEYGRALGGVINVVTKSGGNEFHGDGFIYYDSTGTAADKKLKPGDSAVGQMKVADGQRFDYGADLGGFILKDRLWFFGAYDRVNLDGNVSRVESTPNVSKYDRFPFDATDNLWSLKLTWNPSSSTTLVATFFADPSRTVGASGADPRQGLGAGDVTPIESTQESTWYSERSQGGTDYGLRLIQLFGVTALATAQGSYHRDLNKLVPRDGIRTDDFTCVGGTPDLPCSPQQEPNSVTGGYGFVRGLYDGGLASRAQMAAGLTVYKGNHEVKGGGDYWDGRTEAFGYFTGGQEVGIFNETGIPYYAHDFHSVDTNDPPTIVPARRRSAQVLDYGLYLQDSWRVTPNVTVNAGIRWDGEETRDYSGKTVLRFANGWQPRIGAVWDPWRDGSTKVSAFYGRFSYALPTVAVAAAFGDFTELQTYNFDPLSVEPNPNVPGRPAQDVFATSAFGDPVDAGVKAAYQDEWTLAVERLVTPSLTVGVKGTYRSLGNALEDRCDFNYHAPELKGSSCVLINPGSGARFASGDAPTCSPFPEKDPCPDEAPFGPPGPATPAAKRIYRGLELMARQAVGNSLWFQASYVYSSLRGNYDGGVNEGVYGQSSPGLNSDFDYPGLWHNAYGILALDRTNRFRFDGYWVSPWQVAIGLQAFAETGSPLNKMGFFNDNYGPLVFLEPRGSVGRLPTLWGADLTLSYPIVVGPTTVTLQAYLFNIFNKQIAIVRDDSWSTSRPPDYPHSVYDPGQDQTNDDYGKITHRQEPRAFRAAVKVSF